MNSINIIGLLLTVLIATSSCKKDDQLNLSKQDYFGNEIRLDGYYYIINDSIQINGILYRSGVFSGGHPFYIGESLNKESEMKSGKYYEEIKNSKSHWGIFNVNGTAITFEYWLLSNGYYQTYISEGSIQNDSTYVINKTYRLKNGKKTDEEVRNYVYHFKSLSPKPDSINQFIK